MFYIPTISATQTCLLLFTTMKLFVQLDNRYKLLSLNLRFVYLRPYLFIFRNPQCFSLFVPHLPRFLLVQNNRGRQYTLEVATLPSHNC